ncbi:MAG: DUF2752 domain-containing protein [Bacilli bacterium]|nr:DUF2752 domain-containing protein [Bacilli bacterium]
MNNKKLIVLISIILLVFGILVVFVFDVNCVFKSVIGIPCPGCGLTRGFRELFSGHLIRAEMYNILTIPIFLFLLVFVLLLIYDLCFKKNKMDIFLKIIVDNYKLLILLVFISWIINIIRGI